MKKIYAYIRFMNEQTNVGTRGLLRTIILLHIINIIKLLVNVIHIIM